MKSKNFVAFFITLILISCSSSQSQVATITASPTSTFSPQPPTVKPKPTFTRTPSPTATPTMIPTPTFAPMLSKKPDDQISGIYKFDRGYGGECDLKVVFEPLVVPSLSIFSEISFELFCIRGEPSYNSGHAMAKILFSDHMAVYSPPKIFPDSVCNIVFQFDKKDKVKVTQLGTDFDCGFGHGVYADGIYTRIDTKSSNMGSLEWGCMDIWNLDDRCTTPILTP